MIRKAIRLDIAAAAAIRYGLLARKEHARPECEVRSGE